MDLPTAINNAIVKSAQASVFRATISSLSGNLAYIKRDNQSFPDPVAYPTNAGVTFSPNDEVVVFAIGGSYVVGFKIAR